MGNSSKELWRSFFFLLGEFGSCDCEQYASNIYLPMEEQIKPFELYSGG